MKRVVALLLAMLVCLCSCADVYRYTKDTFFAMNTVVNTIISSDIEEDNTRSIFSDIERRMSRTAKESEIYRLNNGENVELSDDTLAVIKKSLEIAKNTDYAFNPCLGTLTDLWDITSGNNIVPSDEEIKAALAFCNAQEVKVENGKVVIPDGMKIDLGGVAKGYALHKASEELSEYAMGKAVSSDFCISLGGNVAVSGSSKSQKEHNEKGWNVGITNPFDKNEMLASIILTHGYVSVSGAYERFFEKDGKTYHHIFDGKTGYPSDSDLESAVVISDNGLEADALSTALFVMGLDKAVEFYKKGIYDFNAIFVTKCGDVYATKDVYHDFVLYKDAKDINCENVTIIE
ncbi:MAG: FAD:protein FMN transferase [Clostridia bacterium]|nr:FAD:protein FMN transferase [Clostridia bacterium]